MKLVFIISFCLLFHQISGAGYTFPIKTKVIGKFNQYLTKWLSAAQLKQVIDLVILDLGIQ